MAQMTFTPPMLPALKATLDQIESVLQSLKEARDSLDGNIQVLLLSESDFYHELKRAKSHIDDGEKYATKLKGELQEAYNVVEAATTVTVD